jgi:hypothetical protein
MRERIVPLPRGKRSDASTTTVMWIGGALALSWMLYRPERVRPLDITDFSEFLPRLQAADGFLGGLREIVNYYAGQGRFNVIAYIGATLKWEIFGWWSPGWQLVRAAVMVVLVALTYTLLRRLGASRLGSGIACTVYLWAPAAADGWVHLTMAEPLGAALMLYASIRAIRFQGVDRWPREVVIQCAAAACIILSKELLAPTILLPLVLALARRPDGSFARPVATRRNLVLTISVAVATLAALTPVVTVYARAPAWAYASQFGVASKPFNEVIASSVETLVPFSLAPERVSALWAIAVVSYAMLVVVGWRVGLRAPVTASRFAFLLPLALVFPFLGMVMYWPLRWHAQFYELPYLIAAALLLAFAVTFLQLHRSVRAPWVALTLAAPAVLAIGDASNEAARDDARQRNIAAVIRIVADSVKADTILYAARYTPAQEWLGTAAGLHRYAGASGHPWPPTRHVTCETARNALSAGRSVGVVILTDECVIDTGLALPVTTPFRRIDLAGAQLTKDSMRAEIRIAGPGASRH